MYSGAYYRPGNGGWGEKTGSVDVSILRVMGRNHIWLLGISYEDTLTFEPANNHMLCYINTDDDHCHWARTNMRSDSIQLLTLRLIYFSSTKDLKYSNILLKYCGIVLFSLIHVFPDKSIPGAPLVLYPAPPVLCWLTVISRSLLYTLLPVYGGMLHNSLLKKSFT